MRVFALNESSYLGKRIAKALGIELSALEHRDFSDGESKIRPMVSVRGQDVFVVQSLFAGPHLSPHDKLCRLLFLIATMRDHGAARVTAIVPYLTYARKDRRTKSHDPVTTRYVAQLFDAVQCDCVVTLTVHNVAAFQNAFRCQTVHLELGDVFQEKMAWRVDGEPLAVVSPDPGGVKRAQLFREAIEDRLGQQVGFGFMNKRRSAGVMTSGEMVGDFEGASVLIVDDMIASGGTMLDAARECKRRGAAKVYALAAHGLFTGDPTPLFSGELIERVFITDSVEPHRLPDGEKTHRLEIASTAEILADTIKRLAL